MKNTPYFGFPQFENEDNYNVGDYNQAFRDIENAIKNLADIINNIPTLVTNSVESRLTTNPVPNISQKDSSGTNSNYLDDFYVVGNDNIKSGKVILTLERLAQETLTSYGKFERMNKLWLPGLDLVIAKSENLASMVSLLKSKNVSWVTVNGYETTEQYQFELYFNYLTDQGYVGLTMTSGADNTFVITTDADIVTQSRKLTIAIDKTTGSVELETLDSSTYSGIGAELGCEYNSNVTSSNNLNGRCFKFINLTAVTIDGVEETPMIGLSTLTYEAGKPNIPDGSPAVTTVTVNDVVLDKVSFTVSANKSYDITGLLTKEAWNYLELSSTENVKFKVSRSYRR